jgi:hypothetical protein
MILLVVRLKLGLSIEESNKPDVDLQLALKPPDRSTASKAVLQRQYVENWMPGCTHSTESRLGSSWAAPLVALVLLGWSSEHVSLFHYESNSKHKRPKHKLHSK